MATEIKVPEVGESVTEALIVEWLVSEGDYVSVDQDVAVIETDKANLEIPSPAAGTISKILKGKDEWVNVGDVIAQLEEGDDSGKKKKSSKGEPKKEDAASKADKEEKPEKEKGEKEEKDSGKEKEKESKDSSSERSDRTERTEPPAAMPAAQRLLEENEISASDVEGTGKGGRILKEDVLRHLDKSAPESAGKGGQARTSHEPGRETEVVSMSPLRRSVAKRLVEAQQSAALLTTFNEIDMSRVIALRKHHGEAFKDRHGIKLGFMSFFVKAAIEALKKIPEVNAEIREKEIIYHNYYDIGIAVSGKKGLVVPVLRNAERMSFAEIEESILDFAQRAASHKIALEELEGGTFTISNGGVFGSLLSTPIVNPPQSGVLGLHAIQDRPVAVDGQVAIRPMMYVALTYDHRIVDGREAVTFLRSIKECMEDPSRMLLEI
jgi:2-oxoglutarate dehydrogenase E2 component (dihydrolipoamide succinyltransferase)